MSENLHGQQRTNTAAEQGKQQQYFFRNAPTAQLGKELIPAIDNQNNNIDYR
jgi:hypothetical protein